MRHVLRTLALFAVISAGVLVFSPATADAQHHGGHGYGGYGHGYGYGGYGHRYGYGGYGHGYGYGGYGPYGYGGYRDASTGAVRIEVSPKGARDQIEVYVNEARAGVVDDFDGFAQRLRLEEGEYEIELRLPGYKPLRASIFVTRGNTYNLRGQLEALADDQS
jgi:hypothetical protein